jgi:hypothetical protein
MNGFTTERLLIGFGAAIVAALLEPLVSRLLGLRPAA